MFCFRIVLKISLRSLFPAAGSGSRRCLCGRKRIEKEFSKRRTPEIFMPAPSMPDAENHARLFRLAPMAEPFTYEAFLAYVAALMGARVFWKKLFSS